MSTTETASSSPSVPVGAEALAAVQEAVRNELIEHHKAGQKVPTWREGKVVWIAIDENGGYIE